MCCYNSSISAVLKNLPNSASMFRTQMLLFQGVLFTKSKHAGKENLEESHSNGVKPHVQEAGCEI